jgi:hypothetical protein
MWITVRGQTLKRLVICDNPTLKQLFKVEKNIYSSGNLYINRKQCL